jgi:sugar lactone lactonase YvrE
VSKPTIAPRIWQPPPAPGLEGRWRATARPADLALLPVPGSGPEDVAVDHDGRFVVGLDDGRICRLSPDGRLIETVADTGGRPLGIEHRHDGVLVVCDARRGLLLVDPEAGRIEPLVDSVDGQPLRFTNNATLHPDGSVLFTDSSRRFGIDDFKADLLEHSCTGRLLRWRDGDVEVLLDGLAFANGVTLTHGGDAVLVAETAAYRITRLWLDGERAGQQETLVDNLPGFPDNLSTGPTGTVWVALPSRRDATLDRLLPRHPLLRRAVWALPDAVQPQASRDVLAIGLDEDGAVRHVVHGPGDRFHYVTGLREHAGELLLGSLVEGAMARIAVPAA